MVYLEHEDDISPAELMVLKSIRERCGLSVKTDKNNEVLQIN